MDDPFEPDERQRLLINKAVAVANRATKHGHYAPEELVRRMTDEDSLGAVEGDARNRPPRNLPEFQVLVTAVVDEELSTAALRQRLNTSTCTGATAFKFPGSILLMEFIHQAPTRERAVAKAIQAVLQEFPHADFVDPEDANTLVDELREATEDRPPTHRERQQFMSCRAPSQDALALAAVEVAGLADSLMAQGPSARGSHRNVEAEIFEVLPGVSLAHAQTLDGRTYCVTAKTPGIAVFDEIAEGQRYILLVEPRFNLVLHAELMP